MAGNSRCRGMAHAHSLVLMVITVAMCILAPSQAAAAAVAAAAKVGAVSSAPASTATTSPSTLTASDVDGASLAPLYGRPWHRQERRFLTEQAVPSHSPTAEHMRGLEGEAVEVMVLFHGRGEEATEQARVAAEEVRQRNADANLPSFIATIEATFQSLPGLSGRMSADAIDYLRSLPGVEFVEFDGEVQLFDTPPLYQQDVWQYWNLDRADEVYDVDDDTYQFRYNGSGVDVYIVDTGMRVSHTEFEDRAYITSNVVAGTDDSDCNGHGTHVGGIVGGRRAGVAKGVNLYSVKVLGCEQSGAVTAVVSGVDDAVNAILAKSPRVPSVINLSLGASAASGSTLVAFAENAVDNGITVVAAAGNSAELACTLAPALSSKVITATSSSVGDQFSTEFANHGDCVDFIAPGDVIVSASTLGDTTYEYRSGTSMSAPFVAGLAAQYLQANPSATPAQVRAAIDCSAIPNVLRGVPADTPNKLAVSLSADMAAGTCSSEACATDADCLNQGSCNNGVCECTCGYAGFNCGFATQVVNLATDSGSVDAELSSEPDWMDNDVGEAMFTLEVPARGRVQLALCADHTSVSGNVALLSSCPTAMNVTSVAEVAIANSSSPNVQSCTLSDAVTAPVDVNELNAGVYTVIVTGTNVSETSAAQTGFRLLWNVLRAPDECQLSVWSSWSACDAACGYGQQTRSRMHISGVDDASCPHRSETQECITQACVDSCVVNEWTAWSECTLSCQPGGTQSRSRTVATAGTGCPALSESQTCNTDTVCRGCTTSQWTAWSTCSGTCGSDTARVRNRTVISPATDGSSCNSLGEEERCTPTGCVLAVVVLELDGVASLTTAVANAVASAIVTAAAGVTVLSPTSVVVELYTGSRRRRLSTGLRVRATVPVPDVGVGREVVAATQEDIASGTIASAVALSAGGGAVEVKMATAHVTTQNGDQITEDLAAAGDDDNGISDDDWILMAIIALGTMTLLCICFIALTCCCGDHPELKPTGRVSGSARIEPNNRGSRRERRRGRGNRNNHTDLRNATRVVAVGPSSRSRDASRVAPQQHTFVAPSGEVVSSTRRMRAQPRQAFGQQATRSAPARQAQPVSRTAQAIYGAAASRSRPVVSMRVVGAFDSDSDNSYGDSPPPPPPPPLHASADPPPSSLEDLEGRSRSRYHQTRPGRTMPAHSRRVI